MVFEHINSRTHLWRSCEKAPTASAKHRVFVTQYSFTFIKCAPSTVPDVPIGVMNPLRLDCTIIEFGLLIDDEA